MSCRLRSPRIRAAVRKVLSEKRSRTPAGQASLWARVFSLFTKAQPADVRGFRFALGAAEESGRISLLLPPDMHEELLVLRGKLGFDLSKMIRTCIAIGIPVIERHPFLIAQVSKKLR